MSGLGGALATGMAVGTGAAVGREAANYMMGTGHYREGQPQQQQMPQQAPAQYAQQMPAQQEYQDPCQSYINSFMSCISQNRAEIGLCQTYMNEMNTCQSGVQQQAQNQL